MHFLFFHIFERLISYFIIIIIIILSFILVAKLAEIAESE